MAVSTGRVEITPAVGYPMGGYGTDTPRYSVGVNEPLRARCTVLWDNGIPHVIVTADVLGFGPSLHTSIRNDVRGLGVADSRFVLTATHTHNGPVLPEKLQPTISYGLTDLTAVDAYAAWLRTTLVALVRSCLDAPRTPCTLEYYVLDEDFSINRTKQDTGLSHAERDVPTLVARDTQGKPRAVLFGYGTHPVGAGQQTSFDPDYPSEAIKTVEGLLPGCHAQFLTGAAGDQNPAVRGSFIQADAYGRDLGLTVVNAMITRGKTISGPITSSWNVADLPLDITLTDSNIRDVRKAFLIRAAKPGNLPWTVRHASASAAFLANASLDEIETHIPLPLQGWKFAGLRILFSGGELVSGYAEYFRAVYGRGNVWVNAYSNEVPAYIPSDEILRFGIYEAGYDNDSPGIGGGSMAVYDYVAHFRPKRGAGSPDGVEQVLIAAALSTLN